MCSRKRPGEITTGVFPTHCYPDNEESGLTGFRSGFIVAFVMVGVHTKHVVAVKMPFGAKGQVYSYQWIHQGKKKVVG